jgi:hypothetical protein
MHRLALRMPLAQKKSSSAARVASVSRPPRMDAKPLRAFILLLGGTCLLLLSMCSEVAVVSGIGAAIRLVFQQRHAPQEIGPEAPKRPR